MAISFTPEQQKVIDIHDSNVLVSAAAGSGKTAVLTERIVRMVCDENNPVDIDRLLVVTFTNAAAAEMRERITEKISERLEQNPESDHIQRQAALIHNALITTIDSFSLFIIRNHFNEIGLDPAFRVADEGEIKLLRQDVLAGLLEDRFAKKNAAFENCVEFFCPGGRENVLEKYILDLSKYASGFPWPNEWLEERKKDYDASCVEELYECEYGRYLVSHIEKMINGCVDKLMGAAKICLEPDGPYMYGELIENEIQMLKGLTSCRGIEDYESRLGKISFGRLPSKKDDSVLPAKRELVKKIRDDVKGIIKDICDKFFATPVDIALSRGMGCREPLVELINLVLEFDGSMQEKKRERKIIDFSDMEHLALDILLAHDANTKSVKPTAVALEYRDFFKEVLIDEYQDSNLVQEYLLRAVSGEDSGNFNRFMVGDVKQSIYKFRLARPELFLEKYENYGDTGNRICLNLSKNFRSRSQVIDSVNGIFEKIMGRDTGNIEYDDKAALYTGASYPENKDCETELLLVEDSEDFSDCKQAEAMAIAGKIKELRCGHTVTDKISGMLRPVKYSDIVVLLRTNSGWDEEFRQVLEDEGIPVYITSKTGYFASSEVQDVLQLLRVLDNPYQDVPLFGTMKSIFGGFSDEEIAIVRSVHKDCLLYEALCKMSTGTGETRDGIGKLVYKCENFVKKLDFYRDRTVYMPIRELLQLIFDDFDYIDYVTAMPAGSKRRANVEMLLAKASDFESTSYFGLFSFVRYMEQLEKYEVDYGEADTIDENADVVRIMSIHKSKGLEFPITFVAGMSKKFNMMDVNKSFIIDMDMGVACDYVNLQKRVKNKTLRRMVLACKMREDIIAEEMRLLYVALTRAKEKLIMTAVLSGAKEAVETAKLSEFEKLPYTDFYNASSHLDFVLRAALQSDIKVCVVEPAGLAASEMKEQINRSEKRNRLTRAGDYVNEELLQEIIGALEFKYPYQSMERLYTKTTVSELKAAAMAEKDEAAYHSFEETEMVPYIPAFRRGDEKVSGTVRGNAFHRTMEVLDFERLLSGQFREMPKDYGTYVKMLDVDRLGSELNEFLLEKKNELKLSQEYFDAVNQNKIINFLKQEIAYRMWRADRRGELYREQPFVMGIDAGRLIEDIPEGEKVLIQGIIDVFFVEDGKIVLLDYKTDVIKNMTDLHNRYGTQLEYYEEALNKITGMGVKEKILYSFYLETAG